MFTLFDPQTKAQKDRVILKDTDMRMAKYSRRGIITNFLIYVLCLVAEQNFIYSHSKLAITLTAGLLLTTVIRGYLLFRADAIYPRGPAAWRNKYFIATLAGAIWWSVILVTLTLLLDMQAEASLMWLYTVVFFSITAHAFAPYIRFCRVYQLTVLVPASLSTFLIGDVIGVFYGAILLFYCYLLVHHSQLMAASYWDRLEAQYTLMRKTESLEEEKRGTRASVQLINEYMELLTEKMRSVLTVDNGLENRLQEPVPRADFEPIFHNVDQFHRVLNKEIEPRPIVFNIRHFMQNAVRRHLEASETAGVELEIYLSPALPARLNGDASKIGQIVHSMISSALRYTDEGVVFVEVEFLREYEASGELQITIARQSQINKKVFFNSAADAAIETDLDLVLAKAMAVALRGEIEHNDSPKSDGKDLRLRIPVTLAELNVRAEYHRLEYRGRPILLVHRNPRWLDHKRLELDSMGFDVQIANSFKKAVNLLSESVASGRMIDGVVFYAAQGDDQAVYFSTELSQHNELKYIHQFVICSEFGRRYFSEGVEQGKAILHFVEKPTGVFEFELAFNGVFESDVMLEDKNDVSEPECRILWIALGKDFENTHFTEHQSMQILRVGEIKHIAKALATDRYNLAVVQLTDENHIEGINAIRFYESSNGRDSLIPIVGVGPQSVRDEMLENGADHFIDLETLARGDTRALRFWASGRHH